MPKAKPLKKFVLGICITKTYDWDIQTNFSNWKNIYW